MPARFGFNSLSIKLTIMISAICLIAGLSAAVLTLKSEHKQLLFDEHDALKRTSSSFIQQFRKIIEDKESIAKNANQVVKKQLFDMELSYPELITSELDYDQDGSIRAISNDGMSGAFLPQDAFNENYKLLFHNSEVLWQIISPTLTQEFFNYYLISKDNFIRISPPHWALQVDTQHQFSEDLFYSLAAPENNSRRSLVWTPIYYDDIWHKWVVSLLVPLYVNGEFYGITGSDLELKTLINFFPLTDKEQQFFIFDKTGQVLSHPKLNREIMNRTGELNQLLKTADLVPEELQGLIQQTISANLPELSQSFVENDEVNIVNIRKIPVVDWYVGIYKKRSSTLSHVNELEIKFFGLFVLYAILVALLLHQTLSVLVLRRIHTLVRAVSSFGKGNLSVEFPKEDKDEIGVLNGAFRKMASKLKQHVEVLETRLIEKDLAEKQANRLSKAVYFSGSAVVIADENLEIEYVNPKMLEISGFKESDFIGKSILILLADEMTILIEDIELDIANRHSWKGDTLLKNNYNKAVWVSLSISAIRDEQSTITSYVGSAQDISFVKESQRKMEQLAYFDTLTGLANRAFFRMQLRKSMALASRGHYAFALFYFDLDEFKRINDTLGHDAGDQLLLEVANRLQKRLRAEDTIARLGGDEFAVLLSGIKDNEKAAEVAMTIKETLSHPIKLGSNEIIVSASIGITMAPNDSSDEEQLLKHADLAMYEAKAKGKNTYHFYTVELNTAAKERMLIENELRVALKNQQFELHYQPQIDSKNQSIVGYEALIRWSHPTEGMISPAKFIPIAEATGQIVELGEWVLWESSRFAKRLVDQGYPTAVSINLSARQFKDSNLKSLLSKIITATGVNAQLIHLEITESMLIGDIDAAIKQLDELKTLGVSLSIDDFGTGYSSLSYLKRFPVDILKIDRSFVQDIPHDKSDMAITAAIIAMAQKLNLNVVAEGVETSEQVAFLNQNNCFIIQGYYFSKPIPESEIKSFHLSIST